MKQTEVINKLNELHMELQKDLLIEAEDPFSSYDASNNTYIVEIKSRDKTYDSWIIEKIKFDSNIVKAIEESKSFIYLTECNGKIMTWNINRMIAANYDFKWEYRDMPGTTEFNNKEIIAKEVGYLHKADAKVHTKEIL
jgi:hypothetical protein|tara:strand:- start:154 stop:570 length:417 start_codon:yes stop_codon:yes gene_type:complete